MKVKLAGYNVDADVLGALARDDEVREDVTPEILSASYARISRDPRSIEELRVDARREVERTRRSNQTIIFKMGHHSVAEHAVFNLDIIGVSRYVMEEIEHFRLCSYTEKSQRYITLEDDFVIPRELKNTPFESAYRALIRKQNAAYHELFAALKKHVFKKHKALAENPKKHNLLEGWAKEDARYITALATESQVGMTVNARNLELLLRRFASHPLDEVQAVGRAIYEHVKDIAPSIILFHEGNELDRTTYPLLRDFVRARTKGKETGAAPTQPVQLVHADREADERILASIMHTASQMSYTDCLQIVTSMEYEEKKGLFKQAVQHMQFYDSLLREFEYASLTYDMVVSAACFGQVKRHRMATLTVQDYDPRLGITMPPAIKEAGKEKLFQEIIDVTNALYYTIQEEAPLIAPYVLTNAHQRRVLMRTNVRELYHMSRLREDEHAQWDIQNVTRQMTQEARVVLPITCLLIGGKDRYADIYENVFGIEPQIVETALPSARTIK